MEFLRFGSSIPGSYWGCCAVCIIQKFSHDPDEKASIQLVDGDLAHPIRNKKDENLFAGPTYLDIFKQRLRIGTFGKSDMPNHAFLAVLTKDQLDTSTGEKWLKILKDNGFEFIRTIDNSVYSGEDLIKNPGSGTKGGSHPNYLFGLFRNIGTGASIDPYTPPKAWTDLEQVVPEMWQGVPPSEREALNKAVQEVQLKHWEALGAPEFLTEEEVRAAGAPVILAGVRSKKPQQSKEERKLVEAMEKDKTAESKPATAPFAPAPAF